VTSARTGSIVLLEFYGSPPQHSLARLADRLPEGSVDIWDPLCADLLTADSLAALATELVTSNPTAAPQILVVGSCFGAPLASACATELANRSCGNVAVAAIDPVIVTDEVLQAQVAALATRVGTVLPAPELDLGSWPEAVLSMLRPAAVRQAIADGADLLEAADVAETLTSHYALWLRYLELCRRSELSITVPASTVRSDSGSGGVTLGQEVRLGEFAETSDLLAGDELTGWLHSCVISPCR